MARTNWAWRPTPADALLMPSKDPNWTPDSVTYRYRLIAVQETGEEMFAGQATTYPDALKKKDAWMRSHPEHREIQIERL